MYIKAVSTEKITSKPNLHFHAFSRWPPFDISNMFITFVQHGYWYAHCYSIYQGSCEELIYYNGYVFLKYLIEIQCPPFLRWLPLPPISFFRLGPLLKIFSMTYITSMQNLMLLQHSELLCLKSARINWTKIIRNSTSSILRHISK